MWPAAVLSVALLAVAGLASALPSGATTAEPAVPSAASGSFVSFAYIPNPNSTPIKHIVVVMQENHAYDNYFGMYCRQLSPNCAYQGNGIPAGVCLPENVTHPRLGCVAPFPFTNQTPLNLDLQHNWISTNLSLDHGKMDGFVPAEHGNQTMGYFTGKLLPGYWDLAQQYGLGDYFFSSARSYSLANHWYMVSGMAPPASLNNFIKPSVPGLTPAESLYLNQSNATPTLQDQLVNSSVSWKWYDTVPTSTYQKSINRHVAGGDVFAYWNPMLSKAESYGSKFLGHFVDRSQFYADAANGTLPNISWVIPSGDDSEHPVFNVSWGQGYVMGLINAVQNSSDWNSTAIFVSWDEYGGSYDHVVPPQVDTWGLSIRVPLLVVSAYGRVGYISDHLGSFDSLTRFIEWRFGFSNFSARDANAPLPLEYFDFHATPRPAFPIQNNSTLAYPMTLQPLPPPNAPRNFHANVGKTKAYLTWNEPLGGAPVTWYRLSYHPIGNPNATTVVRVDGARISYTVDNLTSKTNYNFSIRAVSATQWSPLVTVSVTTNAVFLNVVQLLAFGLTAGTGGPAAAAVWSFSPAVVTESWRNPLQPREPLTHARAGSSLLGDEPRARQRY